jgi:hypothetical protein
MDEAAFARSVMPLYSIGFIARACRAGQAQSAQRHPAPARPRPAAALAEHLEDAGSDSQRAAQSESCWSVASSPRQRSHRQTKGPRDRWCAARDLVRRGNQSRAQFVRSKMAVQAGTKKDSPPGTSCSMGIDTPETVDPGKPVECGGPEAADRLTELVANRSVVRRTDPGQSVGVGPSSPAHGTLAQAMNQPAPGDYHCPVHGGWRREPRTRPVPSPLRSGEGSSAAAPTLNADASVEAHGNSSGRRTPVNAAPCSRSAVSPGRSSPPAWWGRRLPPSFRAD